MKFKVLMPAMLALAVLSGCATDAEHQPKQTLGTLIGAGLGGLAGAQMGRGKGKLFAVAMGALAGAYLGGTIGQSLDRADVAALQHAQQEAHAVPVGRKVVWNNPDTGHHGAVTPKRDGYDRISGDYCREYETTIFVDGREETGYGSACQKADGTWEIVS